MSWKDAVRITDYSFKFGYQKTLPPKGLGKLLGYKKVSVIWGVQYLPGPMANAMMYRKMKAMLSHFNQSFLSWKQKKNVKNNQFSP